MTSTGTATFDETRASDAARLLRVLAHPKRLLLVTVLCDRQLSARRLGHAVGLSRATVFKHLNQLVEIGLLTVTMKAATMTFSVSSPETLEIVTAIMAALAAQKASSRETAPWQSQAPVTCSRAHSIDSRR